MSLTLPLRNVTRHKVRTYLIIAAITISVGLETGIAITIDSLYDDYLERQRGNNFTDITIQPKLNTSITEMESLKEDIKKIGGVEKVSICVTFLLNKNESGLGSISGKKVILYGLDPDSHPDFLICESLQIIMI